MSLTSGASAQRLRLMAANLTSGTNQNYQLPGIRIFQGLKPDVVMIQEFNYGNNSETDLTTFVTTAFGPTFTYFREADATIPNGVISRYPILQSGEWDDPRLTDRDFVWARIDVPGSRDLWTISVHLKANSTSATDRETQATNLKNFIIAKNIPATDFIAIGGDFNSYSRTEALFAQLAPMVGTAAPHPVDATANGDEDTNFSRISPYDGVYVDPDLKGIQIPVAIGANHFPNGLVCDTRVYTPLVDLAPALPSDSGEAGMQHMAVVKDFMLPLPADPPSLRWLEVKFNRTAPPTLELKFSATVGALYEVEVSTNLTTGTWAPLGQITALSTAPTVTVVTTVPGLHQVRDTALGHGARRYYRVARF